MPASKVKYERKCEFCGKTFLAKTLYSKYCCEACSKKASKKAKKEAAEELERIERNGQISLTRDFITV